MTTHAHPICAPWPPVAPRPRGAKVGPPRSLRTLPRLHREQMLQLLRPRLDELRDLRDHRRVIRPGDDYLLTDPALLHEAIVATRENIDLLNASLKGPDQ